MLKVVEYVNDFGGITAHDTLTLDYDDRKRGRFKSVTDAGEEVGVFLDRGKVLQQGQALKTECGKIIVIIAKTEVLTTAKCDDWLVFSKCCYHLGNRHVPIQVGDRWLRFKPDHVLEEMVHIHGMTTEQEELPFDPESGAYKGGHHHHHD